MELHELLIQNKSLLCVASAGAGLDFQYSIWSNPGSSQYIVGCYTPYLRDELHSFIGYKPETSYTSDIVSMDLAMAAYIRSSEYKVIKKSEGDPIGIGISAAVASVSFSRGEQRAWISIITKDNIICDKITFVKRIGKESRISQDKLITNKTLSMLRDVLKNDNSLFDNCYNKAIERFYKYPIFKTNGTRHPRSEGGKGAVYLPATLNPIHDGHRLMCSEAENLLSPTVGNVKASYLVSSYSPHKGYLSLQEMLFKAGMLKAEKWLGQSRSVEFTHDEPLFIDKARRRPGSIFLIGADTMQRLLDPNWGPDINEMLLEMKELKVSFLVMDRVVNGEVLSCNNLSESIRDTGIFTAFGKRIDISSTTLRA